MRASIVVPTIRPEMALDFLSAWASEFQGHEVILVEDNPERTFEAPAGVRHVSWKEMDQDLGDNAWIISRRSGAIRCYGFLLAARSQPDMIVALDDDCRPEGPGFLEAHWRALEAPATSVPVLNTLFASGLPLRPRGFPQASPARCVLNHGLWNGIPDLDGRTQLAHPEARSSFPDHSLVIPSGTLFPMSSMNLAFRPEILLLMYFPPMGQGQPFHRFDDIWCGFIMKKVCDRMGWAVRTGSPFVRHERASDPGRNMELEAPGIEENEEVWQEVGRAELLSDHLPLEGMEDYVISLLELLSSDPWQQGYWPEALSAFQVWISLCREVVNAASYA